MKTVQLVLSCLINVLIALSSLATSLTLVEVIFRTLEQPERPLSPESIKSIPQGERYDFNRYHPILGFDGIPSIKKEFLGHMISHNRMGNRSPEVTFAKPSGVKRVVLVGDSQTWGFGVGDTEHPAAHLQAILNADGAQHWETINLGVSGYGTDQEVLKYLFQGRFYHPDYVVLQYFEANDANDVSSTFAYGVEKPLFVLHDGTLCLTNIPPRQADGWRRSEVEVLDAEPTAPTTSVHLTSNLSELAVVRYFRQRELRSGPLALLGLGRAPMTEDLLTATQLETLTKSALPCVIYPPDRTLTGPGIDSRILIQKLILLLRERALRDAAKLLVFMIPTSGQLVERHPSPLYSDLKNSLQSSQIPVIDPFDLAEFAENPMRLYGGDHLNSQGNQVIALALSRAIHGQP